MKSFLNKIFLIFKKKNPSGVSDFFDNINGAKQQKFIKKVIRKSNEDQRELVRRYHEKFPESENAN